MQMPFSPSAGINSNDSIFAAEQSWADGDGFRFHVGKAETVGGAVQMASATPVDRVSRILVYDAGGTVSLAIAGNTLRVGAVDTAGTDITPASEWTTTIGTRRCLAMFGDVLLASISGGKLFESSSGAQATEVTAAPDEITCMIVTPSRQVMALGCNEEGSGAFNPRCIRWCDIEDYSNWTTSATNNAGEYILPGQAEIVSGCVLGDNILIWTQADLWLAQFVGDPAQTFVFTRVGEIGLAALDAFAVYRQTAYWMAPDRGVCAFSIGSVVQRIDCPMSAEFPPESSTNPYIFACALSRYGEIWFAIPVGAAVPNRYYVYCTDESVAVQSPVWFRGTFELGGFTAAGAMVDSPLLVDSLSSYGTTTIVHSYGLTVERPFRWDCRKSPTGGGLGISGAYLQSTDFYMDGAERRLMVRGIAPDFQEQRGAVNLTAYVRDRPMAEPVARGPYLLATSTALASCLVNDNVASGDSQVTVDTNAEAMAAGTLFTFAGVNGWDGSDTGFPARFTVATDYPGGDGTIAFTPAIVSSGPGRNVVALPANNAALLALTRASKKDFRASGRIFAFRFETAGPFRVRFGKPLFDVVPLGAR